MENGWAREGGGRKHVKGFAFIFNQNYDANTKKKKNRKKIYYLNITD